MLARPELALRDATSSTHNLQQVLRFAEKLGDDALDSICVMVFMQASRVRSVSSVESFFDARLAGGLLARLFSIVSDESFDE